MTLDLTEYQKTLISPMAQKFLAEILPTNLSLALHSSLSYCWNNFREAMGIDLPFNKKYYVQCLENLDKALVCVKLGAMDYSGEMLSSNPWSAYVGAVGLFFIGCAIELNSHKFEAAQVIRWLEFRAKLEELVDWMKSDDKYCANLLANLQFSDVPVCFRVIPRPSIDFYEAFESEEALQQVALGFQTKYFECFVLSNKTDSIPFVTPARLEQLLEARKQL